jgi:SAM-dependent methyltransferase
MSEELTPHAAQNRAFWDRYSDEYHGRHAAFIERGLAWGVWQLPESELQVLGDVAGRDVLELGCGAAEWSRALHGLGARVVALDNSERRLEWARRANEEAGVEFPLVHASAESTPFPDASFDVVFCDWGAMSFADPYLTVPEASRLLRPGGLLAWSGGTPWSWLTYDEEADAESERLIRDYFGMHRWEDPDGTVDFLLPYGESIRLFRANGLVVEDLLELRPPAEASSSYRTEAQRDWARRWPMEQIWRLRKA